MPYPLAVNDAGIIEPQPIDPTETFVNADDSGLSEASILDYWVWAFSDLVGNTERGVLAEYLVAMAIGAKSPVRNSWGAYDLDAPDGTKIEVKSAAYVQSWYQKHLSNIQFGIRKTLEWIPEKNDFGKERKRQADIYVFCLLTRIHNERGCIANPVIGELDDPRRNPRLSEISDVEVVVWKGQILRASCSAGPRTSSPRLCWSLSVSVGFSYCSPSFFTGLRNARSPC